LTTGLTVAVQLDPRSLTLRPTDAPKGFEPLRDGSRYWPNTALTGNIAARLVARSHRVNGYQALYQQRKGSRVKEILSRADVFKHSDGARFIFDWMDRDQRKSNAVRIQKRGEDPYRRTPANIGAGAWIYSQRLPANYVLLFWRYGRVVAWIRTWGVGVDKTVALARLQQRRIASVLG
jgi:hypothetical protein